MAKVSAFSRILIKLSVENSITDSWRDKASCTSLLETIILENSGSIKKREGVFTIGLEKRAMFMRDNLKQANAMVKELFGGVMVVGMRVSSEMVCKVAGEFYIVKVVIDNTKETGIMECLMAKVFSILKMASDIKAPLNKISSMETVYFTKMTRLYTECGRTTNCRWSIWSNQAWEIND